ncbi:hypothetical protein FACS1894126_2300 [Alphaproteobacteria bacterium]|nr:hypothetical protein FACS1894126_2300 [Alphaproteobacteria bacterium]
MKKLIYSACVMIMMSFAAEVRSMNESPKPWCLTHCESMKFACEAQTGLVTAQQNDKTLSPAVGVEIKNTWELVTSARVTITYENEERVKQVKKMLTGQNLPADLANAVSAWIHTTEAPGVPGVLLLVANLRDISIFAHFVLALAIRSGATFYNRIVPKLLDETWPETTSGINGRIDLVQQMLPLLMRYVHLLP